MGASIRFGQRLRILIHTMGLSCLGGAMILQTLVFTDIAQQGSFTGVEKNPWILSLELALTAFALAYFIYIYQRFIRSVR